MLCPSQTFDSMYLYQYHALYLRDDNDTNKVKFTYNATPLSHCHFVTSCNRSVRPAVHTEDSERILKIQHSFSSRFGQYGIGIAATVSFYFVVADAAEFIIAD